MKTLELVQAVTDELVKRGLPATFEYPGFIAVGGADARIDERFPVVTFGVDDCNWGADIYATERDWAEGNQPFISHTSPIAAECTNLDVISDWAAGIYMNAAQRTLEAVAQRGGVSLALTRSGDHWRMEGGPFGTHELHGTRERAMAHWAGYLQTAQWAEASK